MYHDAAAISMVVETLFHAEQAKRISVLTEISFSGNIESEAAFKTAVAIRKSGSVYLSGISSMSNQRVEK